MHSKREKKGTVRKQTSRFIEMLAILRPEKYVKPHFFQTLENRQHKIMISDRREIYDHLWITS